MEASTNLPILEAEEVICSGKYAYAKKKAAEQELFGFGVKAMNKHDFPKWIFKTSKDGYPFAFRNLRCVEGYHAAVRVGFDGVLVCVLYGRAGDCK
ncbi:hypothetical protein FAY30_26985 (plasmid) [Bacillus sp. S3]|nr:hypothetical protein FAY30_26985 [Bacillus sp. S3]